MGFAFFLVIISLMVAAVIGIVSFVAAIVSATVNKIKSRKQITEPSKEESATDKAESAQKADEKQYARDLAMSDISRMLAQKITLMKLLDAIDAELSEAKKAQRITTLLSMQANTEAKIYKIDHNLEKAYRIINN